jgi:hypothetical protein
MTKSIDELRTSNQARMQQLAAQGVQLSLVPQLIDLLVNTVFDDEQKAAFMLTWETTVSSILDQVESDVRKAKLAAPGSIIPPNGFTPNT